MKGAAPLLYLRDQELTEGVELLFLAGRDFSRVVDRRLGEARIGRAHARALHFIARYPGLAVSDLLDFLGITKQSLGRVLTGLIEAGYVTQSVGPRDRRQRLLKPSATGLALADDLLRMQRDRLSRAYREAGPEAVAGFCQVMTGLLNSPEQAGGARLMSKR